MITERAIRGLPRLLPVWQQEKLISGSIEADLVEGGLTPGMAYDARFHFDSLATYVEVQRNFRTILELARRNVAKQQIDPWEFGKLLHSIQDFYSHSNYIPLYRKYRQSRNEIVGSVPTLEEVFLSPDSYPGIEKWLIELYTGHYPNPPLPDHSRDHGWLIGPGQHKDTWQRTFHIEAMETAERATRWYLMLYLKDPDTWLECARVWRVKRVADGTPLPSGRARNLDASGSMLAVAVDRNSPNRVGAIQALGENYTDASVAALSEIVKSDPDPITRSYGISSLTLIGDPDTIPKIRQSLANDPSVAVRISAARALAAMATPEIEESLFQATDPSQAVELRVATIRELGAFQTAKSRDLLVRRLSDDSRDVRVAALESLGHRGDPGVFNDVVKHVKDADSAVSRAAIHTLGELRNRGATSLLVQIVEGSASPANRRESALALGRIGDYAGAIALERVALERQGDVSLRLSSIQALGMLGSVRKASRALQELLKDKEAPIRSAAAYSAVLVGDPGLASHVSALLRDREPRVRMSALSAMGVQPSLFVIELSDVFADRTVEAEHRILAITALSDVPKDEFTDQVISRLARGLDRAEPIDIQIAAIKLLGLIDLPSGKAALREFSSFKGLDAQVKQALRDARYSAL